MKNKIVMGAVTLLFAGGGTIAADNAQNPYTDKGTTLEIAASSTLPEAGTNKIIVDKTQPKITLQKFNGELSTGIKYEGMAPNTTGSRPFLSKNVEWSDGNQKMEVVPLAASSTYEDGGYEINIILNSAPVSNVFNFSIENADQLDFFYQAPLWQEAGLKAATKDCTDTDCTDFHRPENAVGSYAVYYKEHANHIEGQINYATGKAYHIFRPEVRDTNGQKIWAELFYSNGILQVIVPQDFLTSAVYPVTIDPTFGYSSIGVSNVNNGKLIGSKYTAPDNGTITKLSMYTATAGTIDFQTGYYNDNAGVVGTHVAHSSTVTISADGFTDFTVSGSISNGKVYWLISQRQTTGTRQNYYDAGGTKQMAYKATFASFDWTDNPALTNPTDYFDFMMSIYATYVVNTIPSSKTLQSQGIIIQSSGKWIQ